MEILVAGMAAGAIAGVIVVAALIAIFWWRQRGTAQAAQRKTGAKSEEQRSNRKSPTDYRTTGLSEDEFATRVEHAETYGEQFAGDDNQIRQRRATLPPYSEFPQQGHHSLFSNKEGCRHHDEHRSIHHDKSKSFYQKPNTIPKEQYVAAEQCPGNAQNTMSNNALSGLGSRGTEPISEFAGTVKEEEADGTVAEEVYNVRSPDSITRDENVHGIEEEPTSEIEPYDGAMEKEVRQKIDVPIIKVDSPVKTFPFEVDKKGCLIEALYCNVYFPPGATEHPVHIKMRPEYKYVMKENKIQICPIVNFSSNDKLTFRKSVTIALHTSYTAVPGKKIAVQIIRRKNAESPFEVYKPSLFHGTERFIEFDTRHFCGFSAEVDENQFQDMQKNYYSAIYMKKPTNDTIRYLDWLVYDDCPAVIWERLEFVGKCLQSKEMKLLIPAELFSIRHNHNLQLGFEGQDLNIPMKKHESAFSEKWGSRVSESFQFKIERDASNKDADSTVTYEIVAKHARIKDPKSILRKACFLEWHREENVPNTVFNVTGPKAVGVANNYNMRAAQSQISHVSSASSGIVGDMSDLLSSEDRVEEFDESTPDECDSLMLPTIPKAEFESFLDSQPISQSTPQYSRTEKDTKEKLEIVGSRDKSFTS